MRSAPMAIAADPAVQGRMERAAAAAQVPLDIHGVDAVAAGAPAGQWRRAPVVLLDAAVVQDVAAARLPKRDGVIVLAAEPMTSTQWQACVALGVGKVIAADDADYDVVQILADAADAADAAESRSHPGSPGAASASAPGRVVAVIGACGGAGSSVFAAAIALSAAADGRSVLVDADAGGPGLEVLLGMEAVRGASWSDVSATRGRIPEDALWRALPSVPGSRGSAVLLGFGTDRAPSGIEALDSVLDAVQRAGHSAVVDLPRRRTELVDRVAARAELTVILSPAEVRGCYAAARLVPGLAEIGARLGLVVRGPSPGGVGPGDVAAALSIPLIAAMRPQPGLARSIEGGSGLGRMRGPLRRAAVATLDYAGQRP
jgi:secretion/DNA translocation related CpaE-like protein